MRPRWNNCKIVTVAQVYNFVYCILWTEAHCKWTGGSAFEVNAAENERFTVVCSGCHQNLKIGNSTLSFRILRRRILLKCARDTGAARSFFPHSTNQIIVLWRHRYRCCRPCLSSLLPKLNATSPYWTTKVTRLVIGKQSWYIHIFWWRFLFHCVFLLFCLRCLVLLRCLAPFSPVWCCHSFCWTSVAHKNRFPACREQQLFPQG